MTRNLDCFDVASPIGKLRVMMEGDAIVLLEFADRRLRIGKHLEKYHRGKAINQIDAPARIADTLNRYFNGEGTALESMKVRPSGTDFQKHVWRNLLKIPAGKTWSYHDLAESANSHPRAVGSANGANPCALIIPCHRVIGKDGSLTGYAGGLERKKWLLERGL